MAQKMDGMTYAPESDAEAVVGPGEFIIAAVGLDHGHIYGMCNGLTEAGAELKWVYDPDQAKVEAFVERFPQVKAARSEAEVFGDPEVKMVAGAAVPADRCPLGLRVMDAGKDYFTDKAPMTTLDQLAQARAKVDETGQKYMVYYSERLHTECSVYASKLVEDGAIGRVVQVLGLGPHRIRKETRPDWFFIKERYGGILIDIGSHQIEQFLHYTGAEDATVTAARVANYKFKEYPELEDFGDASLVADNGACGYFRCDWFTPDGLGSWGDGRTFILGTEGYIEMRKYIDVGRSPEGENLYFVDHEGEHVLQLQGKMGFPFFGELILDCLNRTETAMTQEHAFKAAELCLKAQAQAIKVE